MCTNKQQEKSNCPNIICMHTERERKIEGKKDIKIWGVDSLFKR